MLQEGKPLLGKVALVTGGGRGLGESLCALLAEAGANVAIGDLREDLAERTALKARAAGAQAIALRLDVGDEDQAEQAVKIVATRWERIDILVNNAAVDVTLPFDQLSVSDWDTVLGTNLRGPFLMSKYAFPLMKELGRGHIVNVVSTAAKRAWANAIAYHASKWGLLGFSHALHVEARAHNIKVTALIAGGMRTPFLLERFPDIDISTLQDPTNVARAVLFVLTLPDETTIPELMVLPVRETSWP